MMGRRSSPSIILSPEGGVEGEGEGEGEGERERGTGDRIGMWIMIGSGRGTR